MTARPPRDHGSSADPVETLLRAAAAHVDVPSDPPLGAMIRRAEARRRRRRVVGAQIAAVVVVVAGVAVQLDDGQDVTTSTAESVRPVAELPGLTATGLDLVDVEVPALRLTRPVSADTLLTLRQTLLDSDAVHDWSSDEGVFGPEHSSIVDNDSFSGYAVSTGTGRTRLVAVAARPSGRGDSHVARTEVTDDAGTVWSVGRLAGTSAVLAEPTAGVPMVFQGLDAAEVRRVLRSMPAASGDAGTATPGWLPADLAGRWTDVDDQVALSFSLIDRTGVNDSVSFSFRVGAGPPGSAEDLTLLATSADALDGVGDDVVVTRPKCAATGATLVCIKRTLPQGERLPAGSLAGSAETSGQIVSPAEEVGSVTMTLWTDGRRIDIAGLEEYTAAPGPERVQAVVDRLTAFAEALGATR